MHGIPLYGHVRDSLLAKASEKSTVKEMISLIAKLRMYILGTVRVSLLHVIMMKRMTLTVVPNIKVSAYIGTWYYFKKSPSDLSSVLV